MKPYRETAAIANFKKDVSYRKFQKKTSRISSEVDHAMAAIANFKKDVAKDISLVAPLSRFFLCQHIAIRYEKHKRYVSDMCFVYVFARYEIFSNFVLIKFD